MKSLLFGAIVVLATSCITITYPDTDVQTSYTTSRRHLQGVTAVGGKVVGSGVRTTASKENTDERVDLNDILGCPEDTMTDWNYTEIDEDEWKYLDSIGVYWDEKSNCYRKRK